MTTYTESASKNLIYQATNCILLTRGAEAVVCSSNYDYDSGYVGLKFLMNNNIRLQCAINHMILPGTDLKVSLNLSSFSPTAKFRAQVIIHCHQNPIHISWFLSVSLRRDKLIRITSVELWQGLNSTLIINQYYKLRVLNYWWETSVVLYFYGPVLDLI